MKILVDEMPSGPSDCPFYNGEEKCDLHGWVCAYFDTGDPCDCALMTMEQYKRTESDGEKG